MGKKIAPATKNPHKPCAKQVKIWVSHAAKHANPNIHPMLFLRTNLDMFKGFYTLV